MKNKPKTSAQKGRKRTFRLDRIAFLFGFKTWRKFETALVGLEIDREKNNENIRYLINRLIGKLNELLEQLAEMDDDPDSWDVPRRLE